ncbi:MAG: hypothetical protein NT062_16080 [Proteobacteria bacterium]|nr:hypothetical protein [Pseudomonadota bacterium]
MSRWIVVLGVLAACTRQKPAATPKMMPMPSVQVGACGTPGQDGVMGKSPRIDHADRDLDGDGRLEAIVVDRALCTPEGNCYWNVFLGPRPGTTDCSRYVGTFAGSALETLTTRGEDNMLDVRGYWNLHGGRLLLQAYRFVRGGYQLDDALLCRRAADDKLDCAEGAGDAGHDF